MHYSPIADGISNAYSTSQVELSKLILMEVPGENPVAYRPIIIQYNDSIAEQLRELTNNGINVNHTAIRDIARKIMAPSQQSAGTVEIENGWDTVRYAFYALFKVQSSISVGWEVITGYTDHTGMSEKRGASSRVWDYNMKFHVNSHMRLHEQFRHGAHGNYTQTTAANINQVLRPIEVIQGNHRIIGRETATAMRPSDILNRGQRNILAEQHGEMALDTRTQIRAGNGDMGVASARQNESSARRISKLLTGFSHGYRESEGQGNPAWMLGTAAAHIRETDFSCNSLFQFLSEQTGYALTGCITWGELYDCFPYIESIVQPVATADLHSADNYSGWGSSNLETNLAHAMVHLVPSLMSESMAVHCDFVLTNRVKNGQPDVIVNDLQPIFENIEDDAIFDPFCYSVLNDILPEVILDPYMDYEISVNCWLFGLCEVTVSIGGNSPWFFRAPNYADALTSSSIAEDDEHLDLIARHAHGMLEDVYQNSPNPGIATVQYHY